MSPQDFSQLGEQLVVEEWAGAAVGSFLDVGAFDGVTFSSTRALMLAGWQGIMVEPAPDMYSMCRDACAGYPVEVIDAACTAEPHPDPSVALRWTRGQPFSTLGISSYDGQGEEIAVPAVPAHALVERFLRLPAPRVLSLDTEGTTIGLLVVFLQLLGDRVDLVIVEAHENVADERAVALALLHEWEILATNPVNVIASRHGPRALAGVRT